MNKNFFLIILIASFMIACNNSTKFVGSWELESLQLQDELITAADLGNPVYTFNENNTYSIKVSGLAQNGAWALEGDKLTLIDNDNPDSDNILTIVESNEYKFHYTAGEGQSMTNVILKRKE
jgi:hypothetical protein